MSTYNGKDYLREQIDSILSQDCEEKADVKLKLLIRDDGSKDGTQEILRKYAAKYPDQVNWYQGENIGVIKSFFDLIEKSDEKADYYAFSDQDDYWHKEKLRAGIEKIKEMSKKYQQEKDKYIGFSEKNSVYLKVPLLYCCSPLLVDENLKEIDNEMTRKNKIPSFENAVVENIVTGCTIVMNKTLRDMAKKQPPKFTVMHDWWFYLLASCYGELYFDEKQLISYRQHGTNTVGYNTSKLKEFKDRVKRFKGNRRNITNQLKDFVRIYELYLKDEPDNSVYKAKKTKQKIHIAKMLVKYSGKPGFIIKRACLLKKTGIYRQRKVDNIIFKIILLSGSY